MAKMQLKCPNRRLVAKARNSLIAVHNVFGPSRPIRQAKTGLKTVQASDAEAQARVLAAAEGIAYLDGVADGNGVGVQGLVDAIKFPDRSARARPFLAKVAKLAKALPSVLLADDEDTDTDSGDKTFEANDGDETDDGDDGDDGLHNLEAAFAPSKRDDELKRLEAAVNQRVETVCWAREETEIAMGDLERSFRALIKAKDAHPND